MPTKAQEELDRAFLGYVRIPLAKHLLDSSVTYARNVLKNRGLIPKHYRNIAVSLRARKVDWESPMHMLVDSSQIDRTCLSASPYPVKDLQPLKWLPNATNKLLEFLSGNHRWEALDVFVGELLVEKSDTEKMLEQHRAQPADGGQTQISAAGGLTDETEARLVAKLEQLAESIKEGSVWMQKVYDKRKFFLDSLCLIIRWLINTDSARQEQCHRDGTPGDE